MEPSVVMSASYQQVTARYSSAIDRVVVEASGQGHLNVHLDVEQARTLAVELLAAVEVSDQQAMRVRPVGGTPTDGAEVGAGKPRPGAFLPDGSQSLEQSASSGTPVPARGMRYDDEDRPRVVRNDIGGNGS